MALVHEEPCPNKIYFRIRFTYILTYLGRITFQIRFEKTISEHLIRMGWQKNKHKMLEIIAVNIYFPNE